MQTLFPVSAMFPDANGAGQRSAHVELSEFHSSTACPPSPSSTPDVEHLLNRLTALSHGLIDMQERERRAIARELHDEIGQSLAAIRVQFAQLQRRAGDEQLLTMIKRAASMTELTLGRVRNLSLLLHPPQLETLGLEAALRWHLDEQQRESGVLFVFTPLGLSEISDHNVAIAAYRIVQEAVANALSHGRPDRIEVKACADGDALRLNIVDDGNGFDVSTMSTHWAARPSLGLISMTERARLLGGELGVFSTVGKGTRIAALLPWR